MGAIVILSLLFLLAGCGGKYTAPDLDRLEHDDAVLAWKATLDEGAECSSPVLVGWLGRTFLKKNWDDCCWQHDFDYRRGWQFGIDRFTADRDLHNCVDDSGHEVVADIMYIAVRVAGSGSYHDGWDGDE